MIVKDKVVEIAFIVILFGTLLYLGAGTVFQHELDHPKPALFGATDGYVYSKITRGVYDLGHFRTHPDYASLWYNDSVAYHPPLLPVLAAGFAHTSGLSPVESLALIVPLLALFSAFIFYWLIRTWNTKVALISAALFVFLYINNFIIGYTWGQVLFYMGTFFLVSLLYFTSKTEIKHWWLPAGILIAGTVNGHTPAAAFFYGFLVFMLATKFLFKKLAKQELYWWLKQIGLASILALVLSINYLAIFSSAYYDPSSQLAFTKPMLPEEFGSIRVPLVYDFSNPVFYILLFGVVLSIFIARKQLPHVLIASGFMFLVGLSNYLGIRALFFRAFQTRFLWPVYLAVFFGIPIYFIAKRFSKKIIIFALLGLLITGFFVYKHYHPMYSNIIDDKQWEGVQWIEKNTPEHARILYFYGDLQDQWVRYVKRDVHLVAVDQMVRIAQGENFTRTLMIEPFPINDARLMYRTGFFSFVRRAEVENITVQTGPFDVCDFDYYSLDVQTAFAPPLIQANLYFAGTFVNHSMSIVYQNERLAILKNNNRGGECLA